MKLDLIQAISVTIWSVTMQLRFQLPRECARVFQVQPVVTREL